MKCQGSVLSKRACRLSAGEEEDVDAMMKGGREKRGDEARPAALQEQKGHEQRWWWKGPGCPVRCGVGFA